MNSNYPELDEIGVCIKCGKPLTGSPCDCTEVEEWVKQHRTVLFDPDYVQIVTTCGEMK